MTNDRLDIIQWLYDNYIIPYGYEKNYIMNMALKYGDLNTIRWAYDGHYYDRPISIEYSAMRGDLDVIRWIHFNNISASWPPTLICTAAQQGHMNVVKWLYYNRKESDIQKTLNHLVFYSSLKDVMDIYYWLYQQEQLKLNN